MITLLGIRLFLKKAWIWLKHYYWVPLGIIAFVVLAILLRRKPETLAGALKNAIESHKKEVDSIEQIHAEEIEQREKALEDYSKTVKEVQKKFEEKNIELDKKQKKQIEKLVKDNKDNPEELAGKLAETWGFDLQK